MPCVELCGNRAQFAAEGQKSRFEGSCELSDNTAQAGPQARRKRRRRAGGGKGAGVVRKHGADGTDGEEGPQAGQEGRRQADQQAESATGVQAEGAQEARKGGALSAGGQGSRGAPTLPGGTLPAPPIFYFFKNSYTPDALLPLKTT